MSNTQFGLKTVTVGQKIKSFFIKLFILILVLGGLIIYFLCSDFGNSNGVVHDVKDKINSRIESSYNEKTLGVETIIREVLGVEKKEKTESETVPKSTPIKRVEPQEQTNSPQPSEDTLSNSETTTPEQVSQ